MRDRTRVGGVAAEEVGMSADLSQVLPGWRGTDPDGGTWVLTESAFGKPWWWTSADGKRYGFRSQEEAEKADLVPLVADDGRTAMLNEIVDVFGGPLVDPVARARELVAPLDPGNPEHLRTPEALRIACAATAQFVESDRVRFSESRWWAVRDSMEAEANRIEREAAEAEQDRKTRVVATEIARGCWPFDSFENAVAALAEAVRAGRAEREEAEK